MDTKRGKLLSLHPLDFKAAVKGLLKVKPPSDADDTDGKAKGDSSDERE